MDLIEYTPSFGVLFHLCVINVNNQVLNARAGKREPAIACKQSSVGRLYVLCGGNVAYEFVVVVVLVAVQIRNYESLTSISNKLRSVLRNARQYLEVILLPNAFSIQGAAVTHMRQLCVGVYLLRALLWCV